MSSSSVSWGGRRSVWPTGWPNCICGDEAAFRVSGTDVNPGRRFVACAKYPDPQRCAFFVWFDKPICDRGKFLILRQKDKIANLTNEMHYWKEKSRFLEEGKAEEFARMSQLCERKVNEARAMERKFWVKVLVALVVLVVGCMVLGKLNYGLRRGALHLALPR